MNEVIRYRVEIIQFDPEVHGTIEVFSKLTKEELSELPSNKIVFLHPEELLSEEKIGFNAATKTPVTRKRKGSKDKLAIETAEEIVEDWNYQPYGFFRLKSVVRETLQVTSEVKLKL